MENVCIDPPTGIRIRVFHSFGELDAGAFQAITNPNHMHAKREKSGVNKWLADSLLLWLEKKAQVILIQSGCLIIPALARILAAVAVIYFFRIYRCYYRGTSAKRFEITRSRS